MHNDYKSVTVRGQIAKIRKICPHRDVEQWEHKYKLANDKNGDFNHCALCAADASSQVHGGMTMEEIGQLEGISKAAVNFALIRATKKYKINFEKEYTDTYLVLEEDYVG